MELTDKEMKTRMLDILVAFDSYCRKHNLVYMLDYGTLIGAIRHKGFIPWDDDVDVSMPRDEYERFLQLIQTDPMEKRFSVKSIELGNSPYPFAKILDVKTRIINSKSTLHTSLWIDVFPVDSRDDKSEKERRTNMKKIKRYAFLLENSCCSVGAGSSRLKVFLKTFVILYAKMRSPYYYGNKIRQIAVSKDVSNAKYLGQIVWGGLRKTNNLTKSEYYDQIEVEFEGKYFKAPRCFDKYLSDTYGDYMKLPPLNQRQNHGTIAVLLGDEE